MKRTGPTKDSTRKLATHLNKHAKATKGAVYDVLAEQLMVPTRQRAEVDLNHLNKMAGLHKDKVFVVPGKVLSTGKIEHAIKVAAFSFSASAKQKIAHAKGSTMTLDQLVEHKIPPKNMVLVK